MGINHSSATRSRGLYPIIVSWRSLTITYFLYKNNIDAYYTPTLLCARITHFQPCTITQSSERISGQIRVFARILSFCPYTAFRPSPGFATYREWSMGERRLQSTYSERLLLPDYIVTSYLNSFNLLNYNDICLYKQYAILCQQNVSAIRWSY